MLTKALTLVHDVLQYLKSIRLERNRKTGFKCPRGCGKGSAHKDPCPGKIDKSHPIHPRNEEQKKKKKVPYSSLQRFGMQRVQCEQCLKVTCDCALQKTNSPHQQLLHVDPTLLLQECLQQAAA
jgi:hypothetical protein